MEFTVLLTSVADVKTFVDAAVAYPYDVDVLAERYIVDGKSIMGMFSIDLSKPVRIRLSKDGPDAQSLMNALTPYVRD